MMRIDKIAVSGLFGRFDHSLEFKPDERILIITGPNGSGKTTILSIINALFGQTSRALSKIPFREVAVEFDDGAQLKAVRTLDDTRPEMTKNVVELTFQKSAESEIERFFPSLEVHPRDLPFPAAAIEDFISNLDQIGRREWWDKSTNEILGIEEVIERYGDEFPVGADELPVTSPEWLKEIRKETPVRFIDTERLTRTLPLSSDDYYWARTRNGAPRIQRTVRRYSEELADQVQKTLSKYGALAQDLDRTFPVRVVRGSVESNHKMSSLREKLDDVEKKRKKLIDAGLLEQEQKVSEVDPLLGGGVDDVKREVLAVYAQDASEKLSVFDELYDRINAFKEIVNSKLLHKEVQIGKGGISVIDDNGSSLDLETLSSGEQHELVFSYDLLFGTHDNALILFDEPEISLHVLWQQKLLEDLEEMAEISKFRVLLATHSPQIIGGRWDLTIELEGSGD